MVYQNPSKSISISELVELSLGKEAIYLTIEEAEELYNLLSVILFERDTNNVYAPPKEVNPT